MKLKLVLPVLALATAGAAFWPAAGGAATFKGVVVAKQHGTLLAGVRRVGKCGAAPVDDPVTDDRH